jgi:hypothetical protein
MASTGPLLDVQADMNHDAALMIRDEVAQLLAELRPSATLVVTGQLLGAYRTTNEPGFTLERRSLQAATEFGAQYNCDFRFDALVGAGIFTKRAPS